MANILAGRLAATIEGPSVVFLIGMRVNKLWALHQWVLVARAMLPMIAEVAADKQSGFLQAQFVMMWRGVVVVQYWRSFEHLHAYAHVRGTKHLPAWAAVNRSIGGSGSVGIWHETSAVSPRQFECVYVNMPRFGVAAAADHVPAVGRINDARARMGSAVQ
jgi:hypothetical protein